MEVRILNGLKTSRGLLVTTLIATLKRYRMYSLMSFPKMNLVNVRQVASIT